MQTEALEEGVEKLRALALELGRSVGLSKTAAR
jgi:hypothetical protein